MTVNLLQQKIGSGVTVIIRTALETSQDLGAGVVLSCRWRSDVPDKVEPGVCHFEWNICRCACQATFEKSKRYQISNGIKKKMEKSKPIESHESKSKGDLSLFFDYVKNSLDNHSVQEFQQINLRSEMELAQDISMCAANNILNEVQLQANPHVMCGLNGNILGRWMNIEMFDAGERKVSISIAQARNKFNGQNKGSRKDPPQVWCMPKCIKNL